MSDDFKRLTSRFNEIKLFNFFCFLPMNLQRKDLLRLWYHPNCEFIAAIFLKNHNFSRSSFGKPGANCIWSGVVLTCCFLTQSLSSLSKSPLEFSPAFKVT